jgi:nucleoside-diphosphate-sugar epimerase
MKKKILVTGGAGFIGSNFCNRHKDEYEVIALDNLLLGDPDNLDEGVEFIQGDACKKEDWKKSGQWTMWFILRAVLLRPCLPEMALRRRIQTL